MPAHVRGRRRLTSDQLGRGFGSSRLIEYYERLDVPVVALVGQHEARQMSRSGAQTLILSRRSKPLDIAAAVRGAISLRSTEAPLGRPA
jgi:hypothetical protein